MSLKVKKMFERYANDPADALPNKIGPNGVVRLLADLKIGAEDRKVLVLAFKCGAEVMCEFSWEEWERGMIDLRVDSVDALRKRLDEIENTMMKDVSQLKPTYKFSFVYGKSMGQRNLELEVAIAYWRILFKNQFALLPLFEEFMQTKHKKAVTKDAWNLLFDFATTIKADLSNYNDEESWPVMLDDFVAFARPRLLSH